MSVGPAICRVNQNVTCYGALGQELQLELDDGDEMILKKENSYVLKITRNRTTLNQPRWWFIADNRTIIIPSTEREDSGRYRLDTFDVSGANKGQYHLHLNTEAVVSSVKVSYSCVSSKRTVSCSSEGDQLHFNWTLSGNRITHQLDDGNRTLLLEEEQVGQITCHVQNHISHGQSSIAVHQCSDVMFLCMWVLEIITLLSLLGGFHIYIKSKQRAVEELQMSEVLHTSVDQDV
ncbi:uncharacterized protein LOC143508763 [Brachyhypopomus gauderio]|uniref:uncharacterized protein LOC143508763 n=1 Tax=Brachyhypopomus gauderio TaxID=698409 RepID=UPI00404224E9